MAYLYNITTFRQAIEENYFSNNGFNVSDEELMPILEYTRNKTLKKIVEKMTKEYAVQNDFSCGGEFLETLVTNYAEFFHPYVAIVVCIFGTIANILNVVILTRKEMITVPINRILTALAIADMLLMLEYIPFAYYYHLDLPGKKDYPFFGAVAILFHIHITQVLHTTSICLTLTLAIWRYLAIGYPHKNHILCSDRRCNIAIGISYVLSILLCVPTFTMFEISATNIVENETTFTLYHTTLNEQVKNDRTLLLANFWFYAIFIKLLPCIILTIISCWLIKTLFKAKKRNQVLRSYDRPKSANNVKEGKKRSSRSERMADRTTKLLVVVLLLFLLSEFPQGIFVFVTGVKGEYYFSKCYQMYGEVMDMMAILNGSINFILYCCMNRLFRTTFGQLFKHKILKKLAGTPSDMHTTYV